MNHFADPGLTTLYEQRLVAYFDLLGWREHIRQAGNDQIAIGQLRTILLLFSFFQHIDWGGRDPGAQVTSFSDNVVASVPFDPSFLPRFFHGLGAVQLGAACCGYLMRGAVTIGALCHEHRLVFGPALNRAYELENQRAHYPRIILDPDVPELSQHPPAPVIEDGDFLIVDPFQLEFAESAAAVRVDPEIMSSFRELAGMADQPSPLGGISGQLALHEIRRRLGNELSLPLRQRDWEKLQWLFDRLSARLGSPIRASELPRVHPADPQ